MFGWQKETGCSDLWPQQRFFNPLYNRRAFASSSHGPFLWPWFRLAGGGGVDRHSGSLYELPHPATSFYLPIQVGHMTTGSFHQYHALEAIRCTCFFISCILKQDKTVFCSSFVELQCGVNWHFHVILSYVFICESAKGAFVVVLFISSHT